MLLHLQQHFYFHALFKHFCTILNTFEKPDFMPWAQVFLA